MFDDPLYDLESLKLPPTARWARNGITVAGATNGEGGLSLGRLYWNFGIYCDDDDILYIADTGNNRVLMIAPNSTTTTHVLGGDVQSTTLMIYNPTSIFASRTSIYVMDAGSFRVQKWSKDSSNVMTIAGIFGERGDSTSMRTFSNSYSLFVDNYDNLFLSDFNDRVMRFPWNSTSGTNGVIVAGTGVRGFSSAQLNGPSGIFVTDNGILYIADTNNHRIQKWIIGGSSGVTVAGTRTAGRGPSQLLFPLSVLVDSNGYMYITDNGNDRILRWAPHATIGECMAGCTGYWGVDSSQLNAPVSISFDSNGCLYVSDRQNNRVQKFAILTETGIVLIC